MRYVTICIMWLCVAAVGIFGGHMGPFAAIVLSMIAVLGTVALPSERE